MATKPAVKQKPRIAEATMASATSGAIGKSTVSMSRMIEAAMSQEIHNISKDCEAIWADAKLSLEEKNARIAKLREPATMKARMMKARQDVRDKDQEAKKAAADKAKGVEEKADDGKSVNLKG